MRESFQVIYRRVVQASYLNLERCWWPIKWILKIQPPTRIRVFQFHSFDFIQIYTVITFNFKMNRMCQRMLEANVFSIGQPFRSPVGIQFQVRRLDYITQWKVSNNTDIVFVWNWQEICSILGVFLSKHLAVLNFYYPTFTQTMLVNHYPTICQWLGTLFG